MRKGRLGIQAKEDLGWNHVPEVGDTDSKSPSTMINQSNFSGARHASIPSSKGQVYSTNYFVSQVSDFSHVHKLPAQIKGKGLTRKLPPGNCGPDTRDIVKGRGQITDRIKGNTRA